MRTRAKKGRICAEAFQNLESGVALIMTSWLSSFETTHLRAASRACKSRFTRNCAVAAQYIFLEQVARPELACVVVEHPQANPNSPLKCWRIDLNEYSSLQFSRPKLFSKLFKDRTFVLRAVRNDGPALAYADPSLRRDRDVVLAAIANDGSAYEYVDETLKKDPDILRANLLRSRRGYQRPYQPPPPGTEKPYQPFFQYKNFVHAYQ